MESQVGTVSGDVWSSMFATGTPRTALTIPVTRLRSKL